MSQDFAKKNRPAARKTAARKPSGRKKPAPKSQAPAWVWLFTGMVLGAFIMFLVYLSGLTPENVPPATAYSNEDVAEQAEENSIPKPYFGFYELLKENEIKVNKATQEHYQGEAKDPVEYTLQVGSFKSAKQADRVRAELLLLNLSARAETAKRRNGEVWHRVLVGPFSNHSKMQKVRSTLVSNNFEAFLFTRKVKL